MRRVTLVLLALVVLGGSAAAGTLWASGWRLYEIRTGSMSPGMPAGDAVLVRPVHAVHPGEVVTYRGGPDGYTTHRVVALTRAGIVTKGDANRSPDWGYRTEQDVVGRVAVHIPYGGYVLRFGHQRGALAGFLLVAAALLLLPPRRRSSTVPEATAVPDAPAAT